MVDKTSVGKKTGNGQLVEGGRDEEDSRSQRSFDSDLWDTSGVRMSALCLNVLQDISDAASQYSSGSFRTMSRTKKEPTTQKKGFADFFKIKRKRSKSKKKKSTADDDYAADEKKLQNGETTLIPTPTPTPPTVTDDISKKEKRRKKSKDEKKGIEKEFSFGDVDFSGNRSATMPANTRDESISKRLKGKTTLTDDEATAKDKKLQKTKKHKTNKTEEQKEEKNSRSNGPVKRLETNIQKIITNVNQKFPPTEDLANERSKKENDLETPKEEEERTQETKDNRDDKDDANANSDDPVLPKSVVVAGEHRPTPDTRDTESSLVPPRQSPEAAARGRAREREGDRGGGGGGEKLRRGRSEETVKGEGKRIKRRRRALSREWILVKTTTTEYTTTFSPTTKNDQLQQQKNTSNETATTKDNDLLSNQQDDDGREHEKMLPLDRDEDNEERSLRHRPVNDKNNNDFSALLPDDMHLSSSPVVSQTEMKLNEDDDRENSVRRKRSAESLERNSSEPMQSLEVSPSVDSDDRRLLLPQSDSFSFDSTKDSHSPNYSDELNTSKANRCPEATEESSNADQWIESTESHFSRTASDDDSLQTNQQNDEAKRAEKPSSPQSTTNSDHVTSNHENQNEEEEEEEEVERQRDPPRDRESTTSSEVTKSRWTKRKTAIRSRTKEASPPPPSPEDNSHQTQELQGLSQLIDARDWPEAPIHVKTSPRLNKPRWTKRKVITRPNRQQTSSIPSLNSHRMHDDFSSASLVDGDLFSACYSAAVTENADSLVANSAANKPRWTKRQSATRDKSRALVGVNSPMTYEAKVTKVASSPTNARKTRTPKLSPKLRGRQRKDDSERNCLDSEYDTSNQRSSRDGNTLSTEANEQPSLNTEESSALGINDVSTDASFPEKQESTMENSTKVNPQFNCEDFRNNCDEFPSSNLIISKEESLFVDSCDVIRNADDGRENEWRRRCETEWSHVALAIGDEDDALKPSTDHSDSDSDFELCDIGGLDQTDFDITPTNNETLLYSNANDDYDDDDDDDDDHRESSDCETISDRNESRSHDDFQEENEESSSFFDASQDGFDAAYFADIDANEVSAYQDGKESSSGTVRTVNKVAYFSDIDPEFACNDTATGVASHDKDWSSSTRDDLEILKNPVETTESPVLSVDERQMEEEDLMNDEKKPMKEMFKCNSDHKESYEDGDVAKRRIRDREENSTEETDQSSVEQKTTEHFELSKTEGQGLDMMNKSVIISENPQDKTSDPTDSRICSTVVCDQKEKEIPYEVTRQRKTKDEQLSFDEKDGHLLSEQSESSTAADASADGASGTTESREHEGHTPTESIDETIRLLGPEQSTTDHHHHHQSSRETEERNERRPRMVHLAPQHPSPPSSDQLKRESTSNRMTANRRLRSEDDRSSPVFIQRRLYIDVPYSDSGYSETEVETLSPCSFRSSISRADTVTEEGGQLEAFTDDDSVGGGRFSFSLSEENFLSATEVQSFKGSAWSKDSDDESSKVSEPHLGAGGKERMAFDRSTSESANEQQFYVVSSDDKNKNVCLSLFSKRNEFETGIEGDPNKKSLESLMSSDSGIGSSVATCEAFQFPEKILTDDKTTELISFYAENQETESVSGKSEGQLGGMQIKEFINATDSDSGESTLALSALEDVRSVKTNGDCDGNQNAGKHERQCNDGPTAVQQIENEIFREIPRQNISIGTVETEFSRKQTTVGKAAEIPMELNISALEKDRNIVNRVCEREAVMDFTVNESHSVDNSTDVTGKSKELFQNASNIVKGNESELLHNEFPKEQNEFMQTDLSIIQCQAPLRNIKAGIDESEVVSKHLTQVSTVSKNFTEEEFAFVKRNDEILKRLQKLETAIAKINLNGHQGEAANSDIASQNESRLDDGSVSRLGEGEVFKRLSVLENAFENISHDDRTVVSSSEVADKSFEGVKDEKSDDISTGICQYDESDFGKVDPSRSHETKIDHNIDESEGKHQSKIYEIGSFKSEDANKVFADSTTQDISSDSLQNETPAESAKDSLQEKTFGQNERSVDSQSSPVVYPSVADRTSAVEQWETDAEEKTLLLRLVDDDGAALTEELEKERKELIWHENAEMYSIYRQFQDGSSSTDEDWPLPSAWIWNGSRYTNVHRSKANRDKILIRYPDRRPCRSFSCPVPFAEFSLVRDETKRPHQSTSVLESQDQGQGQGQEPERHSSGRDKKQRWSEARSEPRSIEINSTTIELSTEEISIEDYLNGPDDSRDSGSKQKSKEQRHRPRSIGSNREEKCRREEETSIEISSLICVHSDKKTSENDSISSSNSTTQYIPKEILKIEESISRQSNESETMIETAESIHLNEASTESWNNRRHSSAGDIEVSENRIEKEHSEKRISTVVDFLSVTSSPSLDADHGPSDHRTEQHLTTETKGQQSDDADVVESNEAFASGEIEDSRDNQLRQRSQTRHEDKSVTTSADDGDTSTPHHTNTTKSTLTYLLVSTAGILSILLLIYISVGSSSGNADGRGQAP